MAAQKTTESNATFSLPPEVQKAFARYEERERAKAEQGLPSSAVEDVLHHVIQNAPDFKVSARDEWAFVERVADALAEDEDRLCERVYGQASDAFCAGLILGGALERHELRQ
jgi:hypothetical protein